MKQISNQFTNTNDRTLRTVRKVRHYVGLLLTAVSVLFIALNLQLFTPGSFKNIHASLQAASYVSAGDTTVISYPSGTNKCMLPFGNGLAICGDKLLNFELPSKYSQMEMNLSYANPVMRASISIY